jgi:hypothetical protein
VKTQTTELPGRERFLAAVAERIPLDRIVELYLFQPIRQSGVESGVAVIAAAADTPVSAGEAAAGAVESVLATVPSDEAPLEGQAADPGGPGQRYTVFTARYRHVLKGAERGRWEVSVVAEADAPLPTIGAVVRGVQRRAGDVEPPEHITGQALRDALTRLAGGT